MPEQSYGTHKQLYTLVEKGLLNAEQLSACESHLELSPTATNWKNFLHRFFLFLGTSLLALGILLFFAYNWQELHRFSKFALIGGGILAATLLTHFKGANTLTGKASLILATLLTGGLLATYGQIYQTGADPYTLFIGWAVLSLGWVFIARLQALWFVTLILGNLALILYWGEYHQSPGFFNIGGNNPLLRRFTSITDIDLNQLLIIINFAVLVVWETILKHFSSHTDSRWACRIIASFILFLMTQMMVRMLLSGYSSNYPYPGADSITLLYFLGIAGLNSYYRWRTKDLFMIAISYLSLIITITSWAAPDLTRTAGTILILIILVLVISSVSAVSLKYTAQKWRQSNESA